MGSSFFTPATDILVSRCHTWQFRGKKKVEGSFGAQAKGAIGVPVYGRRVQREDGMNPFEKLIPWLGKFHPAAVHFPIGLLVAAAVAEVLFLVTRRPSFAAASRFCVWFGALTAPLAGLLGWCLGGFQLTDRYWVLATHRWLGTCTIAWTIPLLVLSEASRGPGCQRAGPWFRVTLFLGAALVLLTGFFGSAVIYGLDHYA